MTDQNDAAAPPCFDCAGQPTERLIEMFVDMVQKKRIALGQKPAERPVFRKMHGAAHGTLRMVPDLPADLKVGVFAHAELPAWIRISSDTSPTSPDLRSTVGIGIKLFGVPGPKAFDVDGDGNTADFILQNFPVFFVDDAKAMCEFTYAGVVAGDYPSYLAKHPETARILDAMSKVEGSVLTTTYWGILPFGSGNGGAVKYRLDPETPPENVPDGAADYMALDMANRLRAREYRFKFMVQRRTNDRTMPLDQATREWPVAESPFVQVATLTLPRQDIDALGQAEYGQALSYNIFRVPPVQAPVPESSIAAVRKAVYAMSAQTRHLANGQQLADPRQPRPGDASAGSAVQDTAIVKAAIYPAIGVARVGNSPDEFFFGPETPDPAPMPPGFYRDAQHRLKRQAARFRVYGLNAKGEIVRELTGANSGARVLWTVQLANTKSAWYGFQLALDIPEASSAPPTVLRNAAVADRTKLAIVSQPQSVAGPRAAGPRCIGQFMDKDVYLGEISTDTEQRLVVLGGRGAAASYDGSRAITFANNEAWHDDVSDGPVTARVEFEGRYIEATPAWVVVAPPNYGPQQKSVRTMWDLMRDVAVKAGQLAAPARPSFSQDILPIFQRMTGLQWVNAGFAGAFGWQAPFDLTTKENLAMLADPSEANREKRRVVANQFRRFKVDAWSPKPWPWLYGDAMGVHPTPQTPRAFCALSDLQLAMLDQWALGEFDADWNPQAVPPASIDQVPLARQGDVLTKAALEFCLADAFHPGCEMTWPVREASMYMAPFRFKHAPQGWIEPGMGEVLTYDAMQIPNGPLAGQMPGGITRWMAVPWQTDTASCRSGYDKSYDPYQPTFWPARVPNQVMSKESYDKVVDAKLPIAERRAAFAYRSDWLAPLGSGSYTDQINNMIAHFDHLGVVEVRKGPSDSGAFPQTIEVEDLHTPIRAASAATQADAKGRHAGAPGTQAAADLSGIDKVRRFPEGLRRRSD